MVIIFGYLISGTSVDTAAALMNVVENESRSIGKRSSGELKGYARNFFVNSGSVGRV